MPSPRVSAIIVTFNSLRQIRECIRALDEDGYPDLELVLVDNGSTDGGAEYVRSLGGRARVVLHSRNLGWCGAANTGIEVASGDVVLFLNPDVYVRPGCVAALVEVLESEPDVGAVGCKCLYPDGRTIQHAGGELLDLGITRHSGWNQPDNGEFDRRRDCEYVTGAAMAVRRRDLLAVGGIDEDYFPAYYEDVELCRQLRLRGFRTVYEPRAVVIHDESQVLGALSAAFLRRYHQNRLRFLYKNTSRLGFLRLFPCEMRWLLRDRPRDGRTLGAVLQAHASLAVFAASRAFRRKRPPPLSPEPTSSPPTRGTDLG